MCVCSCVFVFVLLIRLSKLLSRCGNVIKDAVLTIIDFRCPCKPSFNKRLKLILKRMKVERMRSKKLLKLKSDYVEESLDIEKGGFNKHTGGMDSTELAIEQQQLLG